MNTLSQEYEQNFQNWIEQHIALLKARKFEELDIKHLIEELEDMGKSDLRELESRLAVLIAHLLKWQFQYQQLSARWQEFKGDSWHSTIIEQRVRLAKRLRKSPGLKANLPEITLEAYEDALELTIKETQLPAATFPSECPYTLEQLLDDDFYPNVE